MNKNSTSLVKNSILFYIHDPMCSWCWAFRTAWIEIQQQLVGNIPVAYLTGGLAPDSDDIMPQAMQTEIQGYWRKIQRHVPDTDFNFDFWDKSIPRRATYAACRASIAARRQNAEKEIIYAIQQAYYLNAQNPSNDAVLIQLAEELALNIDHFSERLNHPETQQRLLAEIRYGQYLGAQGFPSLIFQHQKVNHFIPIDYNDANVSLLAIKKLTTKLS
jgi:putative protein-disulfide isomerase